MKKFPVIFDLETKYTFRDFDDHKKLQISVAAIYDRKDDTAKVFTEQELPNLFRYLEDASYIIGYNINSFDMKVLQAYYPGKSEQLPTFDILDDIRNKIGRRLALNDVISATLGKKKTGHGLMAIDLFKEGKITELKQYCSDDVSLTNALFQYGVDNGEINYLDVKGKQAIRVNWRKYLEESSANDTALTLPF